jgi:hypothetical protein
LTAKSRPKIGLTLVKTHDENTRFHIDFDWWEQSSLDLKTYLSSRLQLGGEIPLDLEADAIDVVDARTGEVRRVDGFQYVLQAYFKQLPDDFIKRASLVDAVFCILLGNANQPLSAVELSERVQRAPDVILKTLGGRTIYQGIRPVLDE